MLVDSFHRHSVLSSNVYCTQMPKGINSPVENHFSVRPARYFIELNEEIRIGITLPFPVRSFSPWCFIKYASLKDYHNNCHNDRKMSCFVLLIKRLRSENWSYLCIMSPINSNEMFAYRYKNIEITQNLSQHKAYDAVIFLFGNKNIFSPLTKYTILWMKFSPLC